MKETPEQQLGHVRGILEAVPAMSDAVFNTDLASAEIGNIRMELIITVEGLFQQRSLGYPDIEICRELANHAFSTLCPLGTLLEIPEVSPALSEVLLFFNRESTLLPSVLELHTRAASAYRTLLGSFGEFDGGNIVSRVKTPGAILRSQIEHSGREVFDILGLTIINPDFSDQSHLENAIDQINQHLNGIVEFSHIKIHNNDRLILPSYETSHVNNDNNYTGVHVYFRFKELPEITIQIKLLTEPHKPNFDYLKYKFLHIG